MSFLLEKIRQRHRGKTVLEIERLEIEPGAITGLAGPNGSGKTTLLNLLACLKTPHEGRLFYGGQSAAGNEKKFRGEISLVQAEPYLLDRSVFENVAYGLRVRGDTDRLKFRVEEALERVGLYPQRFVSRKPKELSSGETQRVAIAGRLILKPKVLLLDEPTKSLDFGGAALLAETLRAQAALEGVTTVIASHDREWIERLSHQMIYLFYGRLGEHRPENFLLADYKSTPDGDLVYEADDIRLRIPPKARRGIAAMVPPSKLIASKKPCPKAQNQLKAVILSVRYEPRFTRFELECQAGERILSAHLAPGEFVGGGWLPGQTLWLCFERNSVSWY